MLANWEAKLDFFLSKLPDDLEYGKSNLRIITDYLYHRYKSLHHYNLNLNEKLNARASVIKAKKKVIPVPDNFGLDDVSTHAGH